MGRWICLALVALAFPVAPRPALAQAQRPDAGAVLTAAALTAADLPAGLALDERRSGLRTTEDGAPAYQAIFVGNGTGELPIIGVVNVVTESPDPATGLDRLTDRFRTGLGGNPTEIAPPAVGEASRAFAVTTEAMGGALTASTVFVAIRRADVVAGVAVTSFGAAPQTDMAVRLARNVDQRLTAALRPGT